MNFDYVAKTDVGKVRDHNEDAYGVCPEEGLFFVCDGMGGHAAGDYASKKTVDTILHMIKNYSMDNIKGVILKDPDSVPFLGRLISTFVLLTNRLLFRIAVLYPKLRGMGTTFSSVMFDNAHVNVINVGDSRVYRLRESRFTQLTLDHSWVEELIQDGEIDVDQADSFKERNVITRALGTDPLGKVDWKACNIQQDDIYLLCSDGLCGELTHSEIARIVNANIDDLDKMATLLIKAANDSGGADNTTVVIVKIKDEIRKKAPKLEMNQIVTLQINEGEEGVLDNYIDKNFNIETVKVPKGVEKEKEKFYKNPILIGIVAVLLLFMVMAIVKTVIFTAHDTVQVEQTVGDILIRTNPPGATIALYKDNQLIEKKASPSDFLSMEEGEYKVIIEKEGFVSETYQVFSKKGTQEVLEKDLVRKAKLNLTLGFAHGFNPDDEIFIDGELWMYYGSPLTIKSIGYVGKSIDVEKGKKYIVKIGELQKEIEIQFDKEETTILLDNGDIIVE